MERRRLGGSDLELSVIGLGTWVFGGRWGGADDAESEAACHASIDAGINWIDTADIYGQGRAERVVGKVLRERRDDEVLVATKGGVAWDLSSGALTTWREATGDYLMSALDRSLTALGLDHVDLYQVHWPVDDVPAEDTMEGLARIVRSGKARAIGVSNYELADLERAASAGSFDSLQVGYHVLRDEIDRDVIPWCAANDVGVLAYGPLGHGLLTGKMGPETAFPPNDWRAESELFSDEHYPARLAAVAELARIAEEAGRPGGVAELAVAWVLRRPEVTSAIVGARDRAQAVANAALAARPLSADEADAIERVAGGDPVLRRHYRHGEPPRRPS